MNAPTAGLSPIGVMVRRADPDRFLTALFAPAAKREALFTLYAFNNETARAMAATEPMIALIRLQWWREVVEGAPKAHEVATPLAALLRSGALDSADLLSILDARETTELPTVAAWRDWLLAGPGALAVAASRLLGGPGGAEIRALGAGYGAAGVLRNTAALARLGTCLLPEEVLAANGLSRDVVLAAPAAPVLTPIFASLADEGRALLGSPHRRGPDLAAALPAVLARRDLRQPGRADPRTLGDRLAVTAAALLGRA